MSDLSELRARDLETLAGRRAAFDAWSARRKRELGPLAGLGFSRTNTGGWCVARHWPHLLCWSWALWLTPYRGPKMDGPRRFKVWGLRYQNGGGQHHISLWFFDLSFHTQDYAQIAALGPPGAGAPLIYPREVSQ